MTDTPTGAGRAGAPAVSSELTIHSEDRSYGQEQPAIGSFGYEPKPVIRKREFNYQGVECPECGSVRTGTYRAGLDHDGQRIRVRKCKDCNNFFTTVEVPIPFTFNRLDVTYKDRASGKGSYIATSREQFDRLTIKAHVRKGGPSPYCRKGLHLLTTVNTYLRKDGSKTCKDCRAISRREYADKYHEYLAMMKREYNARRKQARLLSFSKLDESA